MPVSSESSFWFTVWKTSVLWPGAHAEVRAFMVVKAEALQYPGVGQEGSGLLAIDGLQLMHVLKDWPELDAVTGQQALYGP